MSEKDVLREEVRQERAQLVVAVRQLRADIASWRKKLPVVAGGLGLVVTLAKFLRRR